MRRILAPTDGSPESEKALPLAAQLARAQDAELVIILIVDQPGFGIARPPDPTTEEAAAAELAALEERFTREGLRVRSTLERGPTAATLLDRERAERPDLVVIATHGRTGLARFALGSVADRMVREGASPVLVFRRSTPVTNRLASALVMLDGSGFGESVLPITETLAGKPLQSVTLFRVVQDPGDRAAAETYLSGAAARLAGSGVQTTTVVDVGDPRNVTERAARGHDLVIIATHGRGGFDRLRQGSTADYVVRYVDPPVLLVRVSEDR